MAGGTERRQVFVSLFDPSQRLECSWIAERRLGRTGHGWAALGGDTGGAPRAP